MNEISNVAIIQWQNELMKIKDDRGQTYLPTYLRTIHAQLSSILNHTCRYYNLKTNVARDVETMGEKETDEMSFCTQNLLLKQLKINRSHIMLLKFYTVVDFEWENCLL